MKVKELIKILLDYDMEMEVGLAENEQYYNRGYCCDCEEIKIEIKEDFDEHLFVGIL